MPQTHTFIDMYQTQKYVPHDGANSDPEFVINSVVNIEMLVPKLLTHGLYDKNSL